MHDDLQHRIEAAHAKGCYAPALLPVRESIKAKSYSTREDGYPYVFLADIPQAFHAYIREKSIGSSCPAFKPEHKAYWIYDVDRWLSAIGVELQANFQVHDAAPFERPTTTNN
jgi:hypothetical protein